MLYAVLGFLLVLYLNRIGSYMQTDFIAYEHQGTSLEGILVSDPQQGKKPGILLCHAWRGRDEFICEKAASLAKWGYTTFALDLYGKDVIGKSKEENSRLMAPFMQDRAYLKSRLLTSLECFKAQEQVDASRIVAIGFCFGGLCALDLARSGADLKGAISVHGLLGAPKSALEKSALEKREKIQAKVLALHGHDDPMVPPAQVREFQNEMSELKADWQMHIYGNTLHAFTDPKANDPSFGTVFNPIAAKRAWQSIRNFLEECCLKIV